MQKKESFTPLSRHQYFLAKSIIEYVYSILKGIRSFYLLYIFSLMLITPLPLYAEKSNHLHHTFLFEDHVSVMMVIDAQTGKINHANQAAADFYGYSAEQLKTMYIQSINTLSTEEVKTEMQATMDEERGYFVFKHRLASGEIRTVEVYSYPIGPPEEHQLFSIVHDISDRVATEQSLKQQTSMYYSVLTIALIIQIIVIIILVQAMTGRKRVTSALKAAADATSIIQTSSDLNLAVHQSLGIIGEFLRFDRIWIKQLNNTNKNRDKYQWTNKKHVKPIDNINEIEEYLLSSEKLGRLVQQNKLVCIKTKDLPSEQSSFLEKQGIFTVMLVPIVIRNKSWGFMVLLDYHSERNISESEKSTINTVGIGISSAIEIRQQNVELTKLNNLKNDFLRNISHELRTPLSCISIYTEMLRNKMNYDMDEVQLNCITEIEQNVQRLLYEVETLLLLSKVNTGKLNLNIEEVKAHEVIYNVIDAMNPFFKQKDIILVNRIERVPSIKMDSRAFQLIVTNILNNMLKFLNSQGQITVQLQYQNEGLLCKISDSGPGVRLEERHSVFDRFYQAPQIGASYIGGTALGLSLCRDLIEMHGGKIWIEDSPAGGSIFCFTIPSSVH